MNSLRQQYQLVSERRSALFEYCESVQPDHFTEALPAFANRSMCGLLVHVANVYRHWIAHFAAVADDPFVERERVRDVSDVRLQFLQVDISMGKFFDLYGGKTLITGKISGEDIPFTVTPLELATHVLTHEFHHKGQVLSMSRFLGYTPIDTDVIRF